MEFPRRALVAPRGPSDARGWSAARGQTVRPSRDGEARAGRSPGPASRINSVEPSSLALAPS
eukprot:937596-Pyramimonas_sp.AAC.1